MNILVTGANGQLGNEMRIVSKQAKDHYIFTDVVESSFESIAMLNKLAGKGHITDTTYLDITNLDDIRGIVKKESINVIVNCAAYTNVDAAEDHQELAELLNAKAPENLAIVMKETGGLLIHISTDYVFGNNFNNTPCKEDQEEAPTCAYGLTKYHGEQSIHRINCNHIIIRTAWLYSEFGKNFVKTMLNLTSIKPQLKVVFDQTGSPTYALDLANAIITILEDYSRSKNDNASFNSYSKNGVYHFSNEGVCSWFDFTKMIALYANHKDCDIQPCRSEEFLSKVKRPSYSVLDKNKIKSTFGIKVPYWCCSLENCLKSLLF